MSNEQRTPMAFSPQREQVVVQTQPRNLVERREWFATLTIS